MYSQELTDEIEQSYKFDSAYLQAEANVNANKLIDSIFNGTIKKISRKQAKDRYLYKRLNGQHKLA